MGTIAIFGGAAYLLVAAYFLGKFSAEDYYRGKAPTPSAIMLNLLFAILWPPLLIWQ